MAKRKNKHSTVALVKAMKVIRSKVQALSNRSMISKSVQHVLGFLNPILRGWWQYFRWGSSGRKAAQLRYYVHERLTLFDS